MRRRSGRWSLWLVGPLVVSAVLIGQTGRGPVAGSSNFVALPAPARLLDTRPGASTIDGQFAGIGLRSAQSTLELDVAGRAGLPSEVTSVVLNVTAVDSRGWGFVTVHPTGIARPNASNLNYAGADTIANTVITRVGDGGDVSLYTYAATHLLVDVAGYLPTGSFDPLPAPARLLDTRPGTTTIDGAFAGIGLRPASTTLQLEVAGRAGIPDDAAAVVLNVTAVIPAAWGYLTVHPAGTGRPNASNVNYDAGQTIANTVITRLGAGGDVSIYTSAATHLIVDIAGHLPADSFVPLPAPQRLADTRIGSSTIDGEQAGIGLRPMSSTLQIHVAGRAGIPADASSVVLNVAAVDPYGWGYVTEHPTGVNRPNASNVNYDAGQTIANTVIARLGAGGDVCVYTYGATHLIVDVAGYLPGPAPPPAGPTCPPMVYGEPIDLGNAYARDINNHSVIVGTLYGASAEDSQAVWWPSPAGGPQHLPFALGQQSSAIAINDRDQVLVRAYSSWSGAATYVVEPESGWWARFALAGMDTSPIAINDRGEVVMTAHPPWPQTGDTYVLVWNSTTGHLDTHADLAGDHDVFAADINDFGHVVGRDGDRPFFWDRSTGTVHHLDIASAQSGRAIAVNDRGQMVGRLFDPCPTCDPFAAYLAFWEDYSAAPIVMELYKESPDDLNESGLVIGNAYRHGTLSFPWLWDSATDRWSFELSHSNTDTAIAINDVGQVVGRHQAASHDEVDHVLLWNPS